MARTKEVKGLIEVGNARLAFKNFAGKEKQFNPEGVRNFCVFFEDDIAKTLKADGWNIKWLKPREEGDPEQAYLQVTVSYRNFPPKIMLFTEDSNEGTILNEEDVASLDWMDMLRVDLVIRPYNWSIPNGNSGVKAYVKSMYITVAMDRFEKKYNTLGLVHDEPEEDDIPF